MAIKLDKDDELVWSKLTSGNDDILLVTRNGKSIRFSEKSVRGMGRNTMGVRGILIKKDAKDDRVIQMDVVGKNFKVGSVYNYGKRLRQKNSGQRIPSAGPRRAGSKSGRSNRKNRQSGTSQIIPEGSEEVIITSQKGQIVKLEVASIPKLTRATQGVILMRFSDKTDHVASATCIEK